jgi:hypothetical protein
MQVFPIEPGSRWINKATGKHAIVLRVLLEFEGQSVHFKKSNGDLSTVAEGQFLSMYRPDVDLDLEF